MLLIALVLLALSIGEASANGTEPDGEVRLDDIEIDAEGLEDLAERAESADLDDLGADELEFDDLAGDDLGADDIDAGDLDVAALDADLASDDRTAWPATGATDARAAALARRHSLLGRLDLTLTWRRTEPIASPRRDEVWLYGTWRL